MDLEELRKYLENLNNIHTLGDKEDINTAHLGIHYVPEYLDDRYKAEMQKTSNSGNDIELIAAYFRNLEQIFPAQ